MSDPPAGGATGSVEGLVDAFARALAAGDREAAMTLCTPRGRGRGETPGALFDDAVCHGYTVARALGDGHEGSPEDASIAPAGLAQATASTRRRRSRAAVAMRLTRAGSHERRLWLLAEHDAGWALAGVTASAEIVEAYLADLVPADARLETLAVSARGLALGARVVAAQARHGRVSGVLGDGSLAARAVGSMLDRLLSAPGAQLALVDARELPRLARAAIGFEVRRAGCHVSERIWVIVRWREDDFEVRASTSTMNLEVFLRTP